MKIGEYYPAGKDGCDKDIFHICSASSLALFVSPKPPFKICAIERETIFGTAYLRFEEMPRHEEPIQPATGEWKHIDRLVGASFHECEEHYVSVTWTMPHLDEKGRRWS